MQMMQLLLIAVVGLLLVTAENTTVVGNATATSADKPDVALYWALGVVGGVALVFIVWYARVWCSERATKQTVRHATDDADFCTDTRPGNKRGFN
jgi:hypothetical protein